MKLYVQVLSINSKCFYIYHIFVRYIFFRLQHKRKNWIYCSTSKKRRIYKSRLKFAKRATASETKNRDLKGITPFDLKSFSLKNKLLSYCMFIEIYIFILLLYILILYTPTNFIISKSSNVQNLIEILDH